MSDYAVIKLLRHMMERFAILGMLERGGIEAQKYEIEEYISQVPDLLAKSDNNEQLKMKILEGLGVGVYMHQEGEYKYADWTLFGKSSILRLTPSSLRVRCYRKSLVHASYLAVHLLSNYALPIAT